MEQWRKKGVRTKSETAVWCCREYIYMYLYIYSGVKISKMANYFKTAVVKYFIFKQKQNLHR